jgi:hypothetical protein
MLPRLTEFFNLFDARNIANDTELKALIERAKKVVEGVDTETIRSDAATRSYVGEQMAAIKVAVDAMVGEKARRAYDFSEQGEE